MSLTIFSIPKAFTGHTGVIQRNALDSWMRQADTQVVLFGDDEGIADVAEEVGAVHAPEVARTAHGTPRLDQVFETARTTFGAETLCYVNADIILPPGFAAETTSTDLSTFLLVGARWNCEVEERLDLENPDTWTRLSREAVGPGPAFAIDYFVFARTIEWQMPPLAVGRTVWDNWLIYRARRLKVPVVDATDIIQVIHQAHDYSHIGATKAEVWKGEEAFENKRLAALDRLFTIEDATHVLTPDGVRPARSFRYLRQRMLNRPQLSPFLQPTYSRILRLTRRLRGLDPVV